MLTVLEAIKLSAQYLDSKGIESARINAELLLASVLKCKRLELYLSFDRPLSAEETSMYREFLRRRSIFEPLQYIIGSVEFYGLNFNVNKSVLIPRPETELMVELILEENKNKSGLKILDIGTGSGNIAVSLAVSSTRFEVKAIDISKGALEVAKQNAIQNKVNDRIDFLLSDIKNYSDDNLKYDIIVSNPPYISVQEFPELQKELKYEPSIALTDEADGLSFYVVICEKARNLLKSGGYLYFEIGQNQDLAVKEIMTSNSFSEIIFRKDYQNINRVIRGIKN
ncbi:MAG: peptide chain release factor N(5)-glutamine methyltransferase [Ignavibacteriales bacterium]|nr:MAG: peptide chain release factor N(5)-glutamine methyltransferase [Ignavibacteriales bacterium]